ncbi:MAG: FecR domain-containing protein [Nitrospirae bacterium]|nr:FecR domain-containing protein [Nitrospirota bacterium]
MTTTIRSKPARLLISIFFIAFLLPSLVLAEIAGKLTKVSGRVDVLRAGATAAVPAVLNEDVSIGDIVRTKSDGTAEITFIDNSVMSVGPKSRLGIDEYLYKSEENKRVASLKLHRGKAAFTVPKPVYAAEGSKFEMQTRTAVAGVRGTDGLLLTGPVERVYVNRGIVEFRNPLGLVTVRAGNVGEVLFGRPPIVRPFSGTEFKNQDEGIKGVRPGDKQPAAGKVTVTGEMSSPSLENVPPSTPTPSNVNGLAVTPSQTVITPPLTVIESTGTIVQPKTTPVNINPVFPNTTTGTGTGTGSTGSNVNVNVR